jgi:hypothetical protein
MGSIFVTGASRGDAIFTSRPREQGQLYEPEACTTFHDVTVHKYPAGGAPGSTCTTNLCTRARSWWSDPRFTWTFRR